MSERTTPRVVYIASAQNSGSTMLDALLGNAPGARSLGEVGGFHRYAAATAACDCGSPPASCGPCQAAIAGSGDEAELRRVFPLALKERRLHWLFVPTRARRQYASLSDGMLRAVASSTGAEVLVDSSKNAGRAAALAFDTDLDVRVVHVVRDGRGVLRSRRRRAEIDGRKYRAPLEQAKWLSKNLVFSLLLRPRLGRRRYLLCRYEDLVADPASELARVCAFCDLDATGLADAATTTGVPRRHLFEPKRRVDYATVTLDPQRLAGQRYGARANLVYWLLGGFVSALWGYRRSQGRADRPAAPPARATP